MFSIIVLKFGGIELRPSIRTDVWNHAFIVLMIADDFRVDKGAAQQKF
jgi:hypothetical protein